MRLTRRFAVATLAFGLALAAAPAAFAATVGTYTDAAFKAAQQARKPVLVHVNASWCPTCAQQRPVLGEIEKDPKYKDLMVFSVDFDTQKDVVKAFGVRMQSTLIAFHGTTEEGRSTGETNPGAIRDLVAKTLQ